jgi:hypothetical protein
VPGRGIHRAASINERPLTPLADAYFPGEASAATIC